jgi:hypothetical protein
MFYGDNGSSKYTPIPRYSASLRTAFSQSLIGPSGAGRESVRTYGCREEQEESDEEMGTGA